MRARSAFFAGAGSVAILAVGWQAGLGVPSSAIPTSQAVASGTSGTGTSNANSTTSGSTAKPSSAPSSAPSASAEPAPAPAPVTPTVADGTYDGAVVNTRYGTVQVQAVIAGGQIVDVIAVKLTDADRKSEAISAQVAPMVHDEVLAAQSAHVANISGGTYTTQGYLQSLQSALDAAGFTG
jgi:uncharacterized protein with FMN-binding domain